LAARKAFWQLSRTEITDLCKAHGIAVTPQDSMYKFLSGAVSGVLDCSDDTLLEVLSMRLTDSEVCNEFSSTIQEIDEAMEVLEYSDREVFKSEQVSAAEKVVARSKFESEYREQAKLFRLAKERKNTKKRKVERGTLPTEISQKDAKKFIPAGCSIWRGCTRGSWQGHCKPFARVYESWASSSEHEAMKRVIKKLWEQHLLLSGKTMDECPYTF
jgi:hypothetical protein